MAKQNNSNYRGSAAELSKLLMITQRRVNQLVGEGVITREPEGDFILPEAVGEFYSYKYKGNQEIDYMEEKAKHEKAKRELTEMELQKRRHELHEAEDVELVLTEMLVNARTKLLGIPNKMATALEGLSSGEIEEKLRKEVEECLLELKDYKPTMFDAEEEG